MTRSRDISSDWFIFSSALLISSEVSVCVCVCECVCVFVHRRWIHDITQIPPVSDYRLEMVAVRCYIHGRRRAGRGSNPRSSLQQPIIRVPSSKQLHTQTPSSKAVGEKKPDCCKELPGVIVYEAWRKKIYIYL